MRNLLLKEIKLSSSIIVYLFMLFGLLFFVPGYPILCGVIFSTLGIFKSFEYAREANDIVFSSVLPVSRKDIVKGRYCFVCLIELGTLLLMSVITLLRMTLFVDSPAYRNNFMMNANMFAIGAAFVIFALFNIIFVRGFFKTAYKTGKPFLIYMIIAFIFVCIFETLHHIPGLSLLNSFGFENMTSQILLLITGIVIWILMTLVSYKKACNLFNKIDI